MTHVTKKGNSYLIVLIQFVLIKDFVIFKFKILDTKFFFGSISYFNKKANEEDAGTDTSFRRATTHVLSWWLKGNIEICLV